MGLAGFIIGSVAGLLSGAWVYEHFRRDSKMSLGHQLRSAAAAGVMTTLIDSAIYVPFRVHVWLGGEGTSWGASVFLALCMGICQGILFRDRPLHRGPSKTRPYE